LTSVGTISSGTWQGTTVGTAYGGTGQTTYANGELLIGKTDGTLAKATLTAGTGVAVTNADGSVTVAVDSTVVTTAQTGTVTSTMIADGTIVDADVNASAAIAGTKISPNFGSQNVVTTGTSTAASLIPTGSSVPTNGVYLPAANSVGISTNGTERARIRADGMFEVKGAGTAGTSPAFSINGSAPANSAVVDSSGRLGLGTSSPELQLDIAANSSSTAFSGAGVLSASRFYTGGAIATVRNNSTTEGSFAGIQLAAKNPDNINQSIGLLSVSSGSGLNAPNFVITQRTGPDTMSERMRIDSSGRVGIGTTSPGNNLTVAQPGTGVTATTEIFSGTVGSPSGANVSRVLFSTIGGGGGTATATLSHLVSSSQFVLRAETSGGHEWYVGGSERARIDSSGRLLVGTSTSQNVGSVLSATTQIQTTSANIPLAVVTNRTDGIGPAISLGSSRGATVGSTTILQANDRFGVIRFAGADGVNLQSFGAEVGAFVDGTPGANDMPGRLVFSTTADGASSSTERLRITSAGVLQVADAGNIAVGTTTGTKIGTATTQKIGFYNATPVVQPTAVADATDAATAISQLNALLAHMRTLGLIAT
jgi:hypothetical protein